MRRTKNDRLDNIVRQTSLIYSDRLHSWTNSSPLRSVMAAIGHRSGSLNPHISANSWRNRPTCRLCLPAHDLLTEIGTNTQSVGCRRALATASNHKSPVRLTVLASERLCPANFLDRHPSPPFVEEVSFIQHQTIIIKPLFKLPQLQARSRILQGAARWS